MNLLISSVLEQFKNIILWGTELPKLFLVPLIMLLSLIVCVVVLSTILFLIRLIFGQKVVNFIKGTSR